MSESKPLHEIALERFTKTHAEQVEAGLKEYGTPLAPFNGRDAADDARRELVDLSQYLTQLEMELKHWKWEAQFWKASAEQWKKDALS